MIQFANKIMQSVIGWPNRNPFWAGFLTASLVYFVFLMLCYAWASWSNDTPKPRRSNEAGSTQGGTELV